MVKMKHEQAEIPVAAPTESAVVPAGERSPSRLGGALAGVASKLSPAEYEDGQAEREPLLYVTVRQKPLVDEKGLVLRQPGAFRVGAVADLTYEDMAELLLTVVGFKPGRVYFDKLTDSKPTCRSEDMESGSRERETVGGKLRYGQCKTCWLGQWGSAEGGRQACRENRRIMAVDWSNERPIILTIGPSSLKPWIAHSGLVQDEAKRLRNADGKVPFIHHLLQVKATPEYRAEPAGHFVVRWGAPAVLPEAIQEQMKASRVASMQRFEEATRAQQYEASDYAGGGDAGGEVPF